MDPPSELKLYEDTIEQLKDIKEAVITLAENSSQIATNVAKLATI